MLASLPTMSRYLTPSKIALLALMSLYLDSKVPTPCTVPILSFLVSHLLRKRSALDDPSAPSPSPIIAIADFQAALIVHPSAVPGRSLWDLFLHALWSIDSFDALHVFLDSRAGLLVPAREDLQREAEEDVSGGGELAVRPQGCTLMGRSSPFGIFVRRVQLEFTRLPLHDGITLWRQFVVYREPTLETWQKRNPGEGEAGFDSNLRDGVGAARINEILYGDLARSEGEGESEGEGGLGPTVVSADDAERLMEFQIDKMQKMGQRISAEIRDNIEEMVHAGSTVSSLAYYIKFLDAWKAGDYTSAFENLHRYFDYTMHLQRRTFYQYALVNMAIMEADFGCYSEAIAAMLESISIARENKDLGCLNFSLSWLYNFGATHPDQLVEIQKTGVLGTDQEALSYIKARAKETGMWSLLSTALLGEAIVTLHKGGPIALAFESVTKAAYLNSTKNVTIAVGNQMIMECVMYSRLGLSYMQWSRCEIFKECYAERSLSEDSMKFTCIRAVALSRKGRFDQAMELMETVDPKILRTLKHRQLWAAYAVTLKLQHSLHRDDLTAAQHYLSQLQANPPEDPTIAFAVSLLQIDMHLRHHSPSSAMGLVDDLIASTAATNADIHSRLKLMVLKARIYDLSGVPHKGFSVCLRAANLAHRSRIVDILWEAVGALARVLVALREYDPAASLMRAIMPQVLETDDCALAASSFAVLADAQMGLAGRGGERRMEQMASALSYLENAFDEFARLGDVRGQCEMMAKRAAIMSESGDRVLANDYAAKYLAIRRAAEEEREV